MAVIYGATIYYTWQERNWKQFKQISIYTNFIITKVQKELEKRIELIRGLGGQRIVKS